MHPGHIRSNGHCIQSFNLSGKDEQTLAAHFEAHRNEVRERIAREHPELAERFDQRRHLLDEHLKEKRPEVYKLVERLRKEGQEK